MKRVQRIFTLDITDKPTQIVGYDERRVKAILAYEFSFNNGFIQLGESGQQAKDGGLFYLYYTLFEWYGANPLWGATSTASGGDIRIIVNDIIEVS